jgi:MFS family permease
MHTETAVSTSWSELLTGRNLLRSVALTGGVALHAINVHIVTTILPSVVRDVGGLAYYAWNITLFVVASIVGSALTSKLLDKLGPRRAYLLGLAVFTLGSILCATALSMPWMLAGRSVQGLGGGLLAALGYALIPVLFEQRLWSRAVALESGMWGVATLLGPAVGGLFAAGGAWRLAFWCLLPVALLQAVIVAGQLGGKPTQGGASDPVRIPLLKIALLALSVLLVALAGQVEDLVGKLLGVAAGLAAGVLVAWLDRRPGVALLPTGAYQLSTGMGKVFACVCLLMIGSMTEIFVPYFLQTLHGYAPLQAGYMTAAMAGGWSLASLLSSARSGRDADLMVRIGPLAMTLSLLALVLLLPGDVDVDVGVEGLWLALALGGVGLGIGLGWPHLLTRVLKSARRGEENLASAGITTVQLYAMAIGAALAGLTVNAAGLTEPGGIDGARHAAYALFACFAVTPALAIVLARRVVRDM